MSLAGNAGQKRLDAVLQDASAQRNGSGTASVSGSAAFELYDTYGFPLELTQELAAEQGITVGPSCFLCQSCGLF